MTILPSHKSIFIFPSTNENDRIKIILLIAATKKTLHTIRIVQGSSIPWTLDFVNFNRFSHSAYLRRISILMKSIQLKNKIKQQTQLVKNC